MGGEGKGNSRNGMGIGMEWGQNGETAGMEKVYGRQQEWNRDERRR